MLVREKEGLAPVCICIFLSIGKQGFQIIVFPWQITPWFKTSFFHFNQIIEFTAQLFFFFKSFNKQTKTWWNFCIFFFRNLRRKMRSSALSRVIKKDQEQNPTVEVSRFQSSIYPANSLSVLLHYHSFRQFFKNTLILDFKYLCKHVKT